MLVYYCLNIFVNCEHCLLWSLLIPSTLLNYRVQSLSCAHNRLFRDRVPSDKPFRDKPCLFDALRVPIPQQVCQSLYTEETMILGLGIQLSW